MSGDKENGTWPAQTQDPYPGETLQVFVFFKGRYLGYQCYVQHRVTAGGSQHLDLYLPACNPDDGYWSFEICGGTLVAWLSPLGRETLSGPRPLRRAVEPLDVFPLGPYCLQVKLLRAAGFVHQYADLAAESVRTAAREAEPGRQEAEPEPDSLSAVSGTLPSETSIGGELGPAAPPQIARVGEVVEEVWRAPAADDPGPGERGKPASGATRPEADIEASCPCTPASSSRTPLPEPLFERPSLADEAEILCRVEQGRPAACQVLQAPAEDPLGPDSGFREKEGGETSIPEPSSTETDGEPDPPAFYFSLLREIFRSCRTSPPIVDPARRALEIIRFRGSDLREAVYLEGEGFYTVRKDWPHSLWKRRGGPRPKSRLVSLGENGRALLHIPDGATGRLYSRSGSRDLREVARSPQPATGRNKFRSGHPTAEIELTPDSWAVLSVDPDRYLVHYVARRPRLPVQPLRPRMTRSHAKILSASVVSHIVLILLVGLTVPKGTIGGTPVTDRFAKVDPTVLMTFKKPEPPKPEKPLASLLPPPQTKPRAVPNREPSTRPSARPAETTRTPNRFEQAHPSSDAEPAAGPPKPVDVAQTGLLAALGSPSAAAAGGKATGQSQVLLAAVTNLDAVAVPADSTTFNLAGIAGKLGTSEIQVPTGGGEAIRTVGAQELLKKSQGTVGALASKGTGSGQVKAVVREPPKATISIRGGMSREAVLQVVNTHLDEIRDCYERELLHSPGLTGKIVLEWLIREDGSVGYAKVAFTNIGHSSDLHLCVQAQVTAWKFPKPTDGHEVVVTFPFLFENMGF